jgi:hypothetical protein
VVQDEEEHDALWRAWGQLSDTDREVLALTAWEDLAVRDAARVLDVPPSVFSVQLHRARRRLERHLQQTAATSIPVIPEARKSGSCFMSDAVAAPSHRFMTTRFADDPLESGHSLGERRADCRPLSAAPRVPAGRARGLPSVAPASAQWLQR